MSDLDKTPRLRRLPDGRIVIDKRTYAPFCRSAFFVEATVLLSLVVGGCVYPNGALALTFGDAALAMPESTARAFALAFALLLVTTNTALVLYSRQRSYEVVRPLVLSTLVGYTVSFGFYVTMLATGTATWANVSALVLVLWFVFTRAVFLAHPHVSGFDVRPNLYGPSPSSR